MMSLFRYGKQIGKLMVKKSVEGLRRGLELFNGQREGVPTRLAVQRLSQQNRRDGTYMYKINCTLV